MVRRGILCRRAYISTGREAVYQVVLSSPLSDWAFPGGLSLNPAISQGVVFQWNTVPTYQLPIHLHFRHDLGQCLLHSLHMASS